MRRRTLLFGFGGAVRAQSTRSQRKSHVHDVASLPDWKMRRAAILEAMQSIMGRLLGSAKRCALDLRVEEEADGGSYIRRRISYAAEPDSRVPAFLLIPKQALGGEQRAREALCLHPTDDRLGNKVVAGLGGLANRQYAAELAQRGYVALAPSYPLLAGYQPDWRKLGYASGTMKAIWDNVRGLDLLDSLPFLRSGSYGAIGHSLGGHNAIYTAVFDQRIQAVVSSCGLDSFLDYKNGDIRGWTSDRYMPRLLDYRDRLAEIPFDFDEMLAAIAPRPCLISAPFQDDNFSWESVDRVSESARRVYRLYGTSRNLQVIHPDTGHDFPDDARELAYQLFDRAL